MKCPYNQGVLTNFQEVLGHNPLLWLWPKPMLGDGLRFKIRTEKKKSNMFFKSRRFSEDEDEDSGEDNTNPTGSSSSSRQHLWFRPFDGTPQHKNDEMAEMV
ncbi:hypothetical protein BX616_007095 [Lobosporangium transversale]|nr:hypothetical protein BX616_007095 [Lobosporangium transversale]